MSHYDFIHLIFSILLYFQEFLSELLLSRISPMICSSFREEAECDRSRLEWMRLRIAGRNAARGIKRISLLSTGVEQFSFSYYQKGDAAFLPI